MDSPNRAHPHLLVGMGAVVVGALIVAGFGILSFATDTDPVAAPGLGPLPGVFAVVAALIAWTVVELRAVSRLRPGLGSGVLAGVAAAATHVIVIGIAALPAGIAIAAGVSGHLVTAGYALVTLVAGTVVGAGVAALVRAPGGTPQWPWERDEDDE